MGDEKWLRRRPGRVSGTVVPPPVADKPSPLPRRPGRSRSGHRPDPSRHAGSQGSPESQSTPSPESHLSHRELPDPWSPDPGLPDPDLPDPGLPDPDLPDPGLPEPKLPDNVRLLFQPVLRTRDAGPGTNGSRGTSSRPNRPGNRPGGPGVLSHPVHGPALRELARSADRSASPGTPLTKDRAGTGGWSPPGTVPSAQAGDDLRFSAHGPEPAPAALEMTGAYRGRRRRAYGHRAKAPGNRATRRAFGAAAPGYGLVPPGHGAAGPSHRRHVAWLAALTLLVLLTAAGTMVALLGQHAGSEQAGRGPSGNAIAGRGSGTALSAGGTALAGATTSRAATAYWVAHEVSRSAIIGCDTVMCGVLVKAGVPSGDLLVIRSNRQDPLGADVIVATSVLRSQFGARLGTTYAPEVLASFGSGGSRIDVRVIAAYGAGAYQLALNRDLAARELLGTQIVGNSRIALPADAQTELAAGQVDPRLLITLPALAQQHAIRVLGFYDRAPGASYGVPLSGVKLAGSDPRAGLPPRLYLRWLVNFLRSQRSVYRAEHITAAWQHGRAVVSVRFARPNPIGLLH